MKEKKEESSTQKHNVGARRRGPPVVVRSVSDKSVDDDDDDDYSFTEELELRKELRGLKEKVFEFEEDLELELRRRGFPDVPVVLDLKSGKARRRRPTGAHNQVTSEYVEFFKGAWKGTACAINSDNNVYIDVQQPGRKIYTREPDIAFWGPAKTTTKTRCGATILVPLNLDHPPKRHTSRDQVERVNPDVVIQFSRRNGDAGDTYEEKAIDDMMNRALVVYNPPQANNSPPKLGYLIKIRTKANKRTANDRLILRAIDVYRIPNGATQQDAIKNRKGAFYSRYQPGGPDVHIQIAPGDLGDLGDTTIPPPPTFAIKASDLLHDLS